MYVCVCVVLMIGRIIWSDVVTRIGVIEVAGVRGKASRHQIKVDCEHKSSTKKDRIKDH